MASRNGSPSMSPTVPPTSTMTTSADAAAPTFRISSLISLVTWGMTCNVPLRYAPPHPDLPGVSQAHAQPAVNGHGGFRRRHRQPDLHRGVTVHHHRPRVERMRADGGDDEGVDVWVQDRAARGQ